MSRLLVLLLLPALAALVDGHAWCDDPAGRSGGSISGASTNPVCNAPVAGSLTNGGTYQVSCERANSHGNGLQVTLYSCDPARTSCNTVAVGGTGWTQIGSGTLSTAVSGPQTVGNPVTLAASGSSVVLGEKLVLGDGSQWFDCATLNLASASGGGSSGGGSGSSTASCLTNNGGCDKTASCLATSAGITCTCKFPLYYGNGYVCAPVSKDQYVRFSMTFAGSVCSSSTQNTVTTAVASFLGVSQSLIAYDTCVVTNTGNSYIDFTIAPDRITGAKAYDLQNKLTAAIAQGQTVVPAYSILAGGSLGGAVVVQNNSSSSSLAWIAAAVLVPLFVLAAFGGGYWYYKKRQREGRPITNPCAGGSSSASSDKTYVGVTSPSATSTRMGDTSTGAGSTGASRFGNTAAANTTTTRFGGTTGGTAGGTAAPPATRPVPSAWTAEKDDAGHVYYFNHQTGESTWERPVGVFIPPPK